MTLQLNVNCFEQAVCKYLADPLRTDSKAASNKGFSIARFPCIADTLVQGGSSVLRLNFCAKIPPLRQAANR
jgi:hypothetical protein